MEHRVRMEDRVESWKTCVIAAPGVTRVPARGNGSFSAAVLQLTDMGAIGEKEIESEIHSVGLGARWLQGSRIRLHISELSLRGSDCDCVQSSFIELRHALECPCRLMSLIVVFWVKRRRWCLHFQTKWQKQRARKVPGDVKSDSASGIHSRDDMCRLTNTSRACGAYWYLPRIVASLPSYRSVHDIGKFVCDCGGCGA